jgi:hypothetical protein
MTESMDLKGRPPIERILARILVELKIIAVGLSNCDDELYYVRKRGAERATKEELEYD